MALHDIYPLFRQAEVISTLDPDDLGRIKLRVYPELEEVPEADLPWCLPLESGLHDGDFGMPLNHKWIYCVVWNKYWSEISFTPWCIPDPKKTKFSEFKNSLVSKIKDFNGTPDIQHTVGSVFEDKFVEFHDTKKSQHGWLHPSSTYFMVNKDGEVFVHSVKKATFHNGDDTVITTVDSKSGDIEIETKGNVKRTIKKDAVDEIKGEVKINVQGNASIKTKGKCDIEANGTAKIESKAVCTVKASSMVEVDAPILNFKGNKTQGTVPPSGSGIGCAFPICPVCKVPHSG